MFGALAALLWSSGPRLMNDMLHADDFVPAHNRIVTGYSCRNYNLFMFNECTVKFASRQNGTTEQFTDWRFGRAPAEQVRLLERRTDPSAVTTDVSLRTLWNRAAVSLAAVLLGALMTFGLFKLATKTANARG